MTKSYHRAPVYYWLMQLFILVVSRHLFVRQVNVCVGGPSVTGRWTQPLIRTYIKLYCVAVICIFVEQHLDHLIAHLGRILIFNVKGKTIQFSDFRSCTSLSISWERFIKQGCADCELHVFLILVNIPHRI